MDGWRRWLEEEGKWKGQGDEKDGEGWKDWLGEKWDPAMDMDMEQNKRGVERSGR